MPDLPARWMPRRVQHHLAQPQHRAALYLTLNNLMGAATGILFWLLLARVAGLGPALVGVGYTVVALGTVVGVIAKGGLDTALLVKVPGTARVHGHRLLSFGFAIAASVSLVMTALLAAGALGFGFLHELDAFGWSLVGAIAVLMVLTWLQDAYFLALGRAELSFERNLVLSAGRLLLPIPVILLAFAHPVPVTWGLALAASATVGAVRARRLPDHPGHHVSRSEFLRSAARNVSGGAAEFLPGLLLAPLVLALRGAEAAAYFGIAWTAASLILQTSAAIGRSALAQMVREGAHGTPSAIRKGVAEHAWVVAPMALLVALFAAPLLSVFGQAYATQGAEVLVVLCASVLVVAPVSLYLAVLRSREPAWPLVAFPAAMILALAATAPLLGARYGLVGVAFAWLVANAPFGLYAAWRLRREVLEVMPVAGPAPVPGRADLE